MTTRRACLTVWSAWIRASGRRDGVAVAVAGRTHHHPPSLSLLTPSSRASTTSSAGGGTPSTPTSPYRVISIDRAGLSRGGEGGEDTKSVTKAPAPPLPPRTSPAGGESPLTPHLRSLITFRGGPLTVSEFMATCLTHPTAGYYTARPAVFGRGGDFVTGPDISQLMGELVGVWCAAEWDGPLGRPGAVRLVELGPGRGTLAADLLRSAVGLAGGAWADAIREVVCVEVSPTRRAEQWAALACCPADGRSSMATPPPSTDGSPPITRGTSTLTVPRGAKPVPVSWVASLAEVPAAGAPTLYLAHEFFDALPVHHFQRVDRGQKAAGKIGGGGGGGGGGPSAGGEAPLPASSAWRERLVDASPENSLGPPFRFVLAPSPTPASTTILPRRLAGLDPEVAAGLGAIEVCPAGMAVAADLARRVTGEAGRAETLMMEGEGGEGGGDAAAAYGAGAALIIDYGRAGPPYGDSLVGIKGHAPASVLASPGQADLSARVDFGALASAAADPASGGSASVAVHGPIPQAHFLLGLGLGARLSALEAAVGGPDTEAGVAVRLGALRLVGGHEEEGEPGEGGPSGGAPPPPGDAESDDLPVEGMGYTYQVMALTKGGRGAPAPF